MAGALLAAMSRRRRANNGGARAPSLPRRANNGGAAAPAGGGVVNSAWPGYGRQGLGTRIFDAGRQQMNGGAPTPGAPAAAGGAAPGGAGPGVPASPPPGFYDPALDAQVRASSRGLGDLSNDTNTALTRGANDVTTALGDVFRTRDQTLADLRTSFDRGTADSTLNEGRLNQDYASALTNLQRGYTRLGGNQAQSAVAAGMGAGGAFAQAAAKRATNMAIDRAPIDTSHDRGIADLLTARGRMGEDYTTNTGRVTAGADRQAGAINLGWGRQQEDLGTALTRAQREDTAFGQDVNAQRWWQAQQAGYEGPMSGGARPGSGNLQNDNRTHTIARPVAAVRPPAGLATRIFNAGRRQQRRR